MSNDIYEPKDGNNPHIKNLDEYKDLYLPQWKMITSI